jgi:hypothetical protein
MKKGIYDLPQAGILTKKLSQRQLAHHGYQPVNHTYDLWMHDARPITLSLVVNDLRIKYVGQEHVEHLKSSIEKHYQISCDWTRSA